MKKFLVLINKPQLPLLTYLGDEHARIGDLVLVPFRNKDCIGIIFSESNISEKSFALREIKHIFQNIILPNYTLKFLEDFASYYILDRGAACKMFLPIDLNPLAKIREITQAYQPNLPLLEPSQQEALDNMLVDERVSLLEGVTGSGKTEVYFHAIDKYIKDGKQILLLLPEIGLTNQIIDRFTRSFGFAPEVWNSSVSPAKKRDVFYGVANGSVKVVVGTRSSVFLPFQNLGLIIIDEEHDASYKQEENSLYNARDTAILRGRIAEAKLILVSATPSLETYYNVQLQKYNIASLKTRYADAKMPSISIVDMKKEKKGSWISHELQEAITIAIQNHWQVILFINRRGYAPLLLCRSCSFRFSCKDCSSWLVYHKSKNKLICHHCGYEENYHTSCPECSSNDLVISGPGVERIYEEVAHLFPSARIQTFTSEEESGSNKDITSRMENGEIDILIGTQILSKGYHFPKVSLVGVIDGDFASSNIDLKSTERCFQLLTQVSGRSGRGEVPGRAIIQTYYPDNSVFDILKHNNYAEFYQNELDLRNNSFMPPFSRIVAIIISGPDETRTKFFSMKLKNAITTNDHVRILGPAPASMSKLRGKFRFRILIISAKNINIQKDVRNLLGSKFAENDIIVRAEVDPYSFY